MINSSNRVVPTELSLMWRHIPDEEKEIKLYIIWELPYSFKDGIAHYVEHLMLCYLSKFKELTCVGKTNLKYLTLEISGNCNWQKLYVDIYSLITHLTEPKRLLQYKKKALAQINEEAQNLKKKKGYYSFYVMKSVIDNNYPLFDLKNPLDYSDEVPLEFLRELLNSPPFIISNNKELPPALSEVFSIISVLHKEDDVKYCWGSEETRVNKIDSQKLIPCFFDTANLRELHINPIGKNIIYYQTIKTYPSKMKKYIQITQSFNFRRHSNPEAIYAGFKLGGFFKYLNEKGFSVKFNTGDLSVYHADFLLPRNEDSDYEVIKNFSIDYESLLEEFLNSSLSDRYFNLLQEIDQDKYFNYLLHIHSGIDIFPVLLAKNFDKNKEILPKATFSITSSHIDDGNMLTYKVYKNLHRVCSGIF